MTAGTLPYQITIGHRPHEVQPAMPPSYSLAPTISNHTRNVTYPVCFAQTGGICSWGRRGVDDIVSIIPNSLLYHASSEIMPQQLKQSWTEEECCPELNGVILASWKIRKFSYGHCVSKWKLQVMPAERRNRFLSKNQKRISSRKSETRILLLDSVDMKTSRQAQSIGMPCNPKRPMACPDENLLALRAENA